MAIKFSCASCGKKLSADEHYVGRRAKCPGCGRWIAIPIDVPAAAPPPIDVPAQLPTAAPPPIAATKTCPHCAETIQAAAIKCRYCGESLVAQEPKEIKQLRCQYMHPGFLGLSRSWGMLTLYTDRLTFTGENDSAVNANIRLANINDVNDIRDGGTQLLIIRFKMDGSVHTIKYNYPSTFGERITTPTDRRTSWGEWVRLLNDLAIKAR